MSGLQRSNDPLPANTIRHSEAFERFRQSIEWWEEIEARVADTIAKYNEDPSELMELPSLLGGASSNCGVPDPEPDKWPLVPITERHQLAIAKTEAIAARETAHAAAWERWRSEIAAGRFVPCQRDPVTGEVLYPDKREWGHDPGLGQVDDYACSDDIRGKLRPVFFMRVAFEEQLSALTSGTAVVPVVRRRGLPPQIPPGPEYPTCAFADIKRKVAGRAARNIVVSENCKSIAFQPER